MKPGDDISSCISRALKRYFADLDGESASGIYDMVMNLVERPMLEAVMAHADGNQTIAAEWLGISRSTLRRKLSEQDMI